jgi:hypothetical protein
MKTEKTLIFLLEEEFLNDVEIISIGGVDLTGYPDFCDAYIEFATYNGIYLTSQELNWFSERHPDWVGNSIINKYLC